jgi:Protein of unknown function (DUF3237)
MCGEVLDARELVPGVIVAHVSHKLEGDARFPGQTVRTLATYVIEQRAGSTSAGQRMAAEITSAAVSGRLKGGLAGAGSSDWFTVAPGGLILPDVRLAIQTDDGAVVLIRYGGRLLFVPGQESVAFIARCLRPEIPATSGLTPFRQLARA